MPKSSEIEGLIARLEAAAKADHELDVAIGWTLERNAFRNSYWNARPGKPTADLPDKLDGMARIGVSSVCPYYTDSVDAALALVERCLPGSEYEITTIYGIAHARLPLNGGDAEPCCEGEDKGGSVPLAILLALLRTLSARPRP